MAIPESIIDSSSVRSLPLQYKNILSYGMPVLSWMKSFTQLNRSVLKNLQLMISSFEYAHFGINILRINKKVDVYIQYRLLDAKLIILFK